MVGNDNELPKQLFTQLKTETMKTLEEKSFEMMMRFALSNEEMISVRGGTDEGGDGGEDEEDGDPEKPPVGVKL